MPEWQREKWYTEKWKQMMPRLKRGGGIVVRQLTARKIRLGLYGRRFRLNFVRILAVVILR